MRCHLGLQQWIQSWNADAQKNQSNKHHLHQSRPLIVRYPGGFLHRKELENVEKCRTYYIACRTSSGYHKKLLESMPELHNHSNRKYSQISIHEKRKSCQNLRKLWLFMFTLCFGVCIDKSMWYNFPTYGKALNTKETQLRKDKKQPRNFTGGGY